MAPMNMRPITPPQSVANCWIEVETDASGGEKAVTRPLSARNGHRCSRRQANVDAQAAERRLLEAQLAVVQRDLLGDDRQPEPRAGGGGGRRRRAAVPGRARSRARAPLGAPGPSPRTRTAGPPSARSSPTRTRPPARPWR